MLELDAMPRTAIVFAAHWLNNWNADQAVSDAIHTTHYRAYIAPIYDYLEKN